MGRLNAKLVLTLLLGCTVVAAMLWSVGTQRLLELWGSARTDYLIGALLTVAVTLVLNVFRWHYIMTVLGYRMNVVDTFCQVSGPFVVSSLTPGRAGEVFKLYAAKRISGISVPHSGAALFIERACDLSVMTGFILLGLIVGFEDRLGVYATAARTVVAITLVIIAVLVLSVRHRGVMALLIRVLSFGGRKGIPGCDAGARGLESCAPSFHSVAELVSIPVVLVLTLGVWVFDVVRFWFIFQAFGIAAPPLVIGFVLCLSLLLGVLSYLPGGLVVTEGSMVGLFVLLGLPVDVTTVAVLCDRVLSFWLALVVGAMALSYKADVLLWELGSEALPDLEFEPDEAVCEDKEDQ